MKTSLGTWPLVKLGDHVDLLSGFAFKSSSFTSNESDVPLVKGENLHQGFIDWNAAKKWPSTEYEKYKQFHLQPNDVVLAMDRPWIEAGLKFSWIRKRDPKSLLVQRVARMRGRNGLLTAYLRFIVGSPAFTDYIKPIVTGVNVPHISGDQIRNFRFLLPPPLAQRKAAAILSTYDDLIENNLRRIKILEEMAQNLYREWFVKFRFPGHQHARFTDSPLGRIPEGWGVMALGNLVDTQYGYTESAQEQPIGPKYLRGMDINKTTYINWDEVPYCPISDEQFPKYRLAKGDIVIIRMADPGKVGIVEKDVKAVFASYLVRLSRRSDRIGYYYLFYFLIDERYKGYITGASNGTTRKSASAGVLTGIDILVPRKSILDDFESQVQPLRRLLNNLLDRTTALRGTRDLLLPKLISGEVDVSDLDIAVPDEASA